MSLILNDDWIIDNQSCTPLNQILIRHILLVVAGFFLSDFIAQKSDHVFHLTRDELGTFRKDNVRRWNVQTLAVVFYQGWRVAGFPRDRCQAPKKDFNCLRFSLGALVEFVFTVLFHGGLEVGSPKQDWSGLSICASHTWDLAARISASVILCSSGFCSTFALCCSSGS